MSDIFREVNEELQRKQFKRFWDRYGYVVIGAALLIVVATAGYKSWENYRQSVAAAKGDRFLAAIELSEQGETEKAREIFEELSGDGAGYGVLARFRLASDQAGRGDSSDAIAGFDALARDPDVDPFLQDLARIRAGYLAVDSESYDAVSGRVADLAAAGSSLRFSALEILGLSAWRDGDMEKARGHFQALRDDAETPGDLRQRAEFMLALLKSRLGADADAGAAPATPTQ